MAAEISASSFPRIRFKVNSEIDFDRREIFLLT